MILLLIGLAVTAAVVAHPTSLFVFAVVNAILAFWANGVLANFRSEPQAAPDYAAAVSIITAIGSVVFLIAGLALR